MPWVMTKAFWIKRKTVLLQDSLAGSTHLSGNPTTSWFYTKALCLGRSTFEFKLDCLLGVSSWASPLTCLWFHFIIWKVWQQRTQWGLNEITYAKQHRAACLVRRLTRGQVGGAAGAPTAAAPLLEDPSSPPSWSVLEQLAPLVLFLRETVSPGLFCLPPTCCSCIAYNRWPW